jgi:hypothetical protein
MLNAGSNSILFGNPTSYPPDLDRIVVSDDGSIPPPTWSAYEAELASFSGSASVSYCGNCSGGSSAGNIGGTGSTVTFTNVAVPSAGTYEMEIDYMTSGSRSFFISVNGGANSELDLNGSSFGLPVSTVVPVTLQAGTNTIQFGNPTNYAPNLDRIAISKTIGSANLAGAITAKQGSPTVRIWQVSLTNAGSTVARHTEVNSFSLIQTGGSGACYPKVLPPLPIQVGDIAPGAQRSIEIPIDFSKCSQNALFTSSLVFSSNNGADVGDITEESTTR